MHKLRFDLLTEPLLSTSIGKLTLPDVLAALAGAKDIEFLALQPHQQHGWYAFLVQLSALAAFHARGTVLANAAQWTAALHALGHRHSETWCLVVPDLNKPAFMQPPVPEGSIAKWKNVSETPDKIDLLQTAKNHDVKVERIADPRPEHWVYALVSLQTMQGFSGRDTYGISRMNGAYGNRPCFAVTHDMGWSTRFQRDTCLWLTSRTEIGKHHGFDIESGCALLWLEPWNGIDQLTVSELDPFFIEVCRRIRPLDKSRIIARSTTSEAMRVAAQTTRAVGKEQRGNVADLWTPVRIEDGTVLTAVDLGYERVQSVMFGEEFQRSLASIPQPSDGDEPLLICQVLVRGQGMTDGYHERTIPVPPRARLRLVTVEGRRRLGELSRQRLDQIRAVSKVLRRSVAALLLGGPEKLDPRDPKLHPRDPLTRSFVLPFDREVDRVFFAELFADIDLDFESARSKWLEQLLKYARQAINHAERSAPVPAARAFRARAAAEGEFRLGSASLLAKSQQRSR
jgi:CRISPR system Cascade subunit CasA